MVGPSKEAVSIARGRRRCHREGEAVAGAKVIGLLEGAAPMLVCIPEQLAGSTCLPEVAWIEGGLKAYAMAS